MAVDEDYLSLLNKADGAFSDSTEVQSRLKLPDPEVILEGKVTIIRNFQDIADLINRPAKNIMKHFTRELGIGVAQDGRRLIINKKVDSNTIQLKIKEYMDSYVICYECGSPDTEMERVGRVDVLVCKACGAQHSVKMAKDSKKTEVDVEEGRKYTVTVSEVGDSGEGKANYRGYTILVPGGKKGQTVEVLIKKIRKRTAISEIVK